jgi:Zn-dependent protease with chaperone function
MDALLGTYPAAPEHVSAEVLRLPASYRWRVVAMLLSLFLVLVLYLIFFSAAGLLAYWLLMLPVPNISGRGMLAFLVFKFGGAGAALLIWLFLLKGLFKGQRVETSNYVELTKKSHPELFDFINRLCADTGAPRPRKVFASPDVNAALVYSTSLLNLVIPPRKDLLVGLGVVNVVNVVEFKAVLAHEFGHFAQRSVKLGNYVYVANRVMRDIVYSRDALDQFVENWSRVDIRISFPAWGLKAILWLVRKILAGTFEALNVLHLSLGREMEFNADNVAVSVTGSDAIVHALSRLDFASESLADAASGLDAAADQGLFTDDLFYHQIQSASRLRRTRSKENLGEPPALPDDPHCQVQVFQPEEDGIPDRYRTHPTSCMREKNAKRFYVRSPQDPRSAWIVFANAAELRKEVTSGFYQHNLGRREAYAPRPASEIQQWLDAEHAEMTFDSQYQGLYDGRFINPAILNDMPAQPLPPDQIAAAVHSWIGEAFKKQVETYHQHQQDYQLMLHLKSGDWKLKGKTFSFRGQERTARELKGLFDQVDKDLDVDIETFNLMDRQIFLAHWSLARQGDGNNAEPICQELLDRYRFHLAVQGLLIGLRGEQNRLHSVFQYIAGRQGLEQSEFQEVRNALHEIYNSLDGNLEEAKKWQAPTLTNVAPGTSLYAIIFDRGDPLPKAHLQDSISGEWLGSLAGKLDGVLKRVSRLQFKSLGALLAFQQSIRAGRLPLNSPAKAELTNDKTVAVVEQLTSQ